MTEARPNVAFIESAVAEFEGPLVSYAVHMTGNVDRARDAVQETFLRLCRADPSEVRDRLAPWLFTVCRSRVLDIIRKEGRMKPQSAPAASRADASAPAPAAAAEAAEEHARVQRAIEALPDRQREALRLKFQQGLRYREIARVMETTVSNVGVLIHTAVNSVRGRLAVPRAGLEEGGAA